MTENEQPINEQPINEQPAEKPVESTKLEVAPVKPSVADLALLGHYSKLLHNAGHTLDRLLSEGQRWAPQATSFGMGLVDYEQTDEETDKYRVTVTTHTFYAAEILGGDIHQKAEDGKLVAKQGIAALAQAVQGAFETVERHFSKIVFYLAERCYGEEYSKELIAEHGKKMVARWDILEKREKKKLAEAEAAMTPEEKAAKEELLRKQNEEWEQSRKRRQIRELKFLARTLNIELDNSDMTIKEALARLESNEI